MFVRISINQIIAPVFSMHQHDPVYEKKLLRKQGNTSCRLNKLCYRICKTFPDSMQLLVNPKLLRLQGFSSPGEGTNAD